MQTEDRQRDDPDACEYEPPAAEAFCRSLSGNSCKIVFARGIAFWVGNRAGID